MRTIITITFMLLLTACGGGGSSSGNNSGSIDAGLHNDGQYLGRATSSIAYASNGSQCKGANITATISSGDLSATFASDWGISISASASVNSSGTITNGTFSGSNISGTFSGSLSNNAGSGNWSDSYGCSGTFSLTKQAIDDSAGSHGSLDSTFGTGGKVTTAVGSSNNFATALDIQSDGKIVVAGRSYSGTNYHFAVARYNIDGTLDTSFGTGGKVTTEIGSSYDYASAIGIQSTGKIVVAGTAYNGSDSYFAVVRYNTDGTLDTTFGTGGKVTTAIGLGGASATALLIQPDCKIVVAGNSYNGSNVDFAIIRYDTDGSLDTSFGTTGKVTTGIGSSHDYATALGIQSDGKIVAAGHSVNYGYVFAVVRYNTDGTLDTSFGTGGMVTTAVGSGSNFVSAVGIQSDGKIVVAGYSGDSFSRFAVVRYNINGTLDTSFGTGGMAITGSGYSSSSDQARALAIQPDGKIVIAGYFSFSGNYSYFAIVRYNTDGTIDSTFGTEGKVSTAIGTGSSYDFATALGIQSDGKIVAAGGSGYYNSYNTGSSDFDFALVSYLP